MHPHFTWSLLLLTCLNFLFVVVVHGSVTESFVEEVLISPLPDGKVLTHFQFTTQLRQYNSSQIDTSFQHFNLFPKSLGQILHKHHVRELHLTFTQGRWMYERWGYPVYSAPIGVELWAWFQSEFARTNEQIDKHWQGLTNELSALFCASLHFLDDSELRNFTIGAVKNFRPQSQTSQPHRSFRPEGHYNSFNIHRRHHTKETSFNTLRYGTLPHEAVCTENLTPWIKLLPCRSHSGFGRLLASPPVLYDVNFHSMGIHYRPICTDEQCTEMKIELIQTLSIVNDPFKTSGRRDFNFNSLFRAQHLPLKTCPLATRSTVFVTKPSPENAYQIHTNAPPVTLSDNDHRELFAYTFCNNFYLNVNFSKEHNSINFAGLNSQVDVIVHRYVTGYGQQKGGLVVHFENRHPNTDLLVTYYQSIPWFVRLYFHTIRVVRNHKRVAPTQIFHYERVVPAEDRISPSVLELEFWLKANTTLNVAIDFDKAFLHYTEHPPDANRGFDIASGIMTVHFNGSTVDESISRGRYPIHYYGLEWSPLTYSNIRQLPTNQHKTEETMTFPIRIYTEGILISLPTPDFSMPYNVITLTCTVFALYFGTMFNIVTRNFKEIYKDNEFVSNRPIARLIRKLVALWKSFSERSTPATQTTATSTSSSINQTEKID